MPDTAEGRRLLRQNIWLLCGLGAVVIVGFLVLGWLANESRLTAEDNRRATEAQFQSDDRGACITQRRSVQFDALGQMQVHTLRALDAAFLLDDDALVRSEVDKGLAAAEMWDRATATLEPEALNLPRSEGGCGPPVTSLDELDDAE